MVATKADVDRVLSATKGCLESWQRIFDRTICRCPGKKPTKKRIEPFNASNMYAKATRGIATRAVHKEWKGISLLTRQYHNVVMAMVGDIERMNDKERKSDLCGHPACDGA